MDVNRSYDWNLNSSEFGNMSLNNPTWQEDTSTTVVTIILMIIACVGIITNFTVVVVFLNNKKFRGKIPVIYIINQVRRFTLRGKCVFHQDL